MQTRFIKIYQVFEKKRPDTFPTDLLLMNEELTAAVGFDDHLPLSVGT